MTPLAVSSRPHDDSQQFTTMTAQHHYPHPLAQSRYQEPYYGQPPQNGRERRPVIPRGGPYATIPHLDSGTGALSGGYGRSELSAPSTPTTPFTPVMAVPPSPIINDLPLNVLPPSNTFSNFKDVRSSPKSKQRPPLSQIHPALPLPSRWDSFPTTSGSSSATNVPPSPRSPRYVSPSAAAPPGSQLRSRPATPTAYDAPGSGFDSYSEPPSRPLTAKSSFPEMRHSSETNGGIENFSRPRKQSIRQPISDTPNRRPQLLPTPSEDGLVMTYNDLTSPLPQPRRPSVSSNISSSTWASGMSPITTDFPDRIGGYRARVAGPPPVSATRPYFGYNSRIDSSGSAPTIGGAAPWVGGDEVRSSFRSQLTASSAPGTANTERSSVLTKDSSTTSFDANHDLDTDGADPDEPSLEDVMGMYEEGFEDDEDVHDTQRNSFDSRQADGTDLNQQPSTAFSTLDEQDDHFPLGLASQERAFDDTDGLHFNIGTRLEPSFSLPTVPSDPQPSETELDPAVESEQDSGHLQPPPRSGLRLDAEIRQSKMLFSSPAFLASLPHLAAMDGKEGETDKRDSGKSLESDPSDISQPTVTSSPGLDGGMALPLPTPTETIRSESPSPILASSTLVEPPTNPVVLPPSAPSAPEEVEAPGTRDRYGFKKETQHIKLKQYDKWDAGYTEYLARRKKKWTAFLKESALMTDEPNRFPAAGPKTKKFIRKGIPPEWRGAAWFYYAGGPAILAKHGGLYEKLLKNKAKRIDVEAIERDLHRTFPDNINFRPPGTSQATSGNHEAIGKDDTVAPNPEEPPIISSLRRVLFAFSIYNPNIGYCQSLNFIAGLLLLFVDTEEQCFWLLNVITHIYLPGTHEMSLEGSKVDLSVLMTEIRDTMPSVWDKIGGELEGPSSRPSTAKSIRRPKFRRKEQGNLPTERLPPITLCMTAWFMSCFIGTLPIETTLRVWDVFFYEGSKTLFRVSLAIFKAGESEIHSVSDPMEIFGVVQGMPRKMIDANALMETCFKRRNGFSHLSQGTIDERRQERRNAHQADMNGRRSKTMTEGSTTSGEPPVRRRGTLFSRRKKRDPSNQRSAEV